MLRLLKYEFRKALVLSLIILGATIAIEGYFLYGLYGEHGDALAIGMVLLLLCAYVAALFVFVRGVTSYSGELRSRNGYLVFMTPNSCLKILGSKFLYTFLNGLIFALIFVLLAVYDLGLIAKIDGDYVTVWEGISSLLRMSGVYVDQILLGVLFVGVYAFLMLLAVIGAAYFAVTLSHTLFRDRKWRWLAAIVFFIAIVWVINRIDSQFTSALDELTFYSYAGEAEIQVDALEEIVLPALAPTACVSLVTILLSLFGSAKLLKDKVSL